MNKNSKVLALKYRPTIFDDLIGQDVVKETITNAIKDNKIPNAYLFTGIRGVGKTTIARIIAKSLNCKNGIDNIGNQNSCENCHCESIANSNHIDVLEMDAASKTGVDDVRDLIEFSRYGPSIAKYKIFIIDEVHMLSKQAFNALLKTLEEPPEYKNGGSLKFIFATTEIKKIPVTVVSRCQRFDLSRVKSQELFNYVKKIKDKENGKITDEALKLIVKISEGSVRDALSLLDRAIISNDKKNELNLKEAQRIFGYFDKSVLISLFEYLLKGEEKKVLSQYRLIYDQGVEPRVFLNDFLEMLYYFKNINFLKIESTNFSLNDEQFNSIKDLANQIEEDVFVLFWQFTIQVIQELDIVVNQNLSVEMFLIRLMYLKSIPSSAQININVEQKKENSQNNMDVKNETSLLTSKAVEQIKNIAQEEEKKKIDLKNNDHNAKVEISSFENLIELCNFKKEVKIKYELENNVNLVSFQKKRIEISFNENLSKDFIKLLSSKLFEWTNERWIITLSKEKGKLTKKEILREDKEKKIESLKKKSIYHKILNTFKDAELIEIEEDIND
ncbi:DNA polymerase III subunit gamma/tau [Pelagibacterales bacterium SAG-MED15]|nr:DNA polymerase III subunit gamma/tau [Pelagibacterales bacterium SAG-MED15]